MRKLLLKLLFPKLRRYDFYFEDKGKKKYFHLMSPYELNDSNAKDFAKAINEVVEIYKPYTEETLGKIKYIMNKSSTVTADMRAKMREAIVEGKEFAVGIQYTSISK